MPAALPRPARVGVLCLILAVHAGCANTPPAPPEPPEWNDARRRAAGALAATLRAIDPEPGVLVVRLAFAAGADLDLYVTDPRLETVYYANTPVVSGGALEADRRCDATGDGPRVETVRFAPPPPGRYRIGIDFPHRCDGGPDEVAWAITIDDRGERRELTGLARWLEFTTIVYEFDVAP